jgi:hypothetical protein
MTFGDEASSEGMDGCAEEHSYADVYLEQRSHESDSRNALVSVFLRELEYYQGIIFLTANRVRTFGEVFQSRIHLQLMYSILLVSVLLADVLHVL